MSRPSPTSAHLLSPLYVTACSLVSALGHGNAATLEALRERRSGLRPNDFLDCNLDTSLGRVTALDAQPPPAAHDAALCRSSRLSQLGLQQDGFTEAVAEARRRYGAQRIALFIGTSSSGILEAELGFRRRDPATAALPADLDFAATYNLFSPAAYVRSTLQLQGPACCVSAACASSAKVFASAARAISAGLCDAAVVGGVETLCFTTLHGFASLELLSPDPCRPCDAERNGISIGEAAGFALLEAADSSGTGLALVGYGESSDAWHMSSPHPQGLGAARAMREALGRAGLAARDVDYVNLHGTGTPGNDAAEDAAVHSVLGCDVACSSTKGWTGHTLGAAGAVEAIITLLCLRHDFVPGTLNTTRVDPLLKCQVALDNTTRPLAHAMSNSFGFGGSNCTLIFGKRP